MSENEQQELFQQALAPEPTPEATPTEPVTEPVSETPAEPAAQPTPSPEENVPSWRLREESEARRAAEERNRQLEAHLRRVQPPQPGKAPDFFDDPNAAVRAAIVQMVGPIYQENRRAMLMLARGIAVAHHTAEKVDEAERAFMQAYNERRIHPSDYERVVRSPNRYEEVVQWHKRTGVLTAVGPDPKAWFEQELEKHLADPKNHAALLEKVRSGAGSRPSVTNLPPSLSRTTAAAGNREDVGDLSDASLYAHAMRK